VPRTKVEPAALFAAAPLPIARLGPAERLACLRLIRSENVGPITFRELINHYGGAQAALEALPELSRRGGRGRPIRICPREVAEAEFAAAASCGAEPIFTIEPGYPPALAVVDAPPPLLYVKGRRELLSRSIIGIVGSRQSSAAGQKLTRQFARDLGVAGYVIASGLARGIDAAAHEASLETGTIAVVAGGVDVVYPPEHVILQAQIGERGCVVSDQPPGFRPRGQDFPRRNRIIAGVALGVLVVEAARRSGTLITARMAAEQGREVFAVPGHPLDPRAEGTNHLLKQGATLASEAADIVAALTPISGTRDAGNREHVSETPAASRLEPPPLLGRNDRDAVFAALGPAPIEVDEIARATGLPARTARLILMELDLAGRIEHHGHQLVSLRIGTDGE
jgi:DNA processing protein